MRIYQVVSAFAYGDAIGGVTLAMKNAIRSMGYETEIFAENIDERLPAGAGKLVGELPELSPDDVVIYHLSNGAELNRKIAGWNCRKIICYHNITPPHFFKYYNETAMLDCARGLRDARLLAAGVDYCLADSEYNKQDLIRMGFKQQIDVLPILMNFKDYDQEPDSEVLKQFQDGGPNILFTGRVAPNKKIEDVIRAFYYYKTYLCQDARLFLVGSKGNPDTYYRELQKYTEELGLKDVYFTGHISFKQILAYYRLADLFLCMSEHEGFCVPVVEAMYFGIPIIAYDSCAVPETLGKGGILTGNKDPKVVAELIGQVLGSEELKKEIIENQKTELERFQHDRVMGQFGTYLREFIAKQG